MNRYRSYAGDPYWTTSKFNSIGACGHLINKGETIFFYPRGKHVYCNRDACGGHESRSFVAAAEDEAVFNRQF